MARFRHEGGKPNRNKDDQIELLHLTEWAKAAMVEFLKGLSGLVADPGVCQISRMIGRLASTDLEAANEGGSDRGSPQPMKPPSLGPGELDCLRLRNCEVSGCA